MKITKEIQHYFLEVLEQSKAERKELGGFGLYLPDEDKLLKVYKQEDLPSGSVVKSEPQKLVFHSDITEQVQAFNERKTNRFLNNDLPGNVYLVGYHTHPLPEQEIVPGDDDHVEMVCRSSPLEIIISAQAEEYWPELPIVVGYRREHFPYENADFFRQIKVSELETISQRLKVSPEIVAQLVRCHHQTGLIPALNVEVVE